MLRTNLRLQPCWRLSPRGSRSVARIARTAASGHRDPCGAGIARYTREHGSRSRAAASVTLVAICGPGYAADPDVAVRVGRKDLSVRESRCAAAAAPARI